MRWIESEDLNMYAHSKTRSRILVVDDEETIREVVRRYLEREGFEVSEAIDGPSALARLSDECFDLMILDWMLPGMDGAAIAARVRQESELPIVMLTARGEVHDRIEGLERGVDDYVVKPFSPRELVLRVRAILRRAEEAALSSADSIELHGVLLDPAARTVSVQEQQVSLTAKEFELLHFLMRHPRQVFSRDQLLDRVWGYEFYGDPSTVTVHIRRLREKIEHDPSNPVRLLTVWGAGYKFDG